MPYMRTQDVAQIKTYLAAAFGVARKTISRIRHGHTHQRVRPEQSVPELEDRDQG